MAGDAIRSRSRYSALSETAIFGRACLHEFPKKFINMKHGERFKIRAFLVFFMFIIVIWLLNCLLIVIDLSTKFKGHCA